MLGDIVKVTPSSKAVGDLALFMVANSLTPQDVLEGKRDVAFPESIIDLVGGMMGEPPGGFPEGIRKRILRDRKPMVGRPGETLAPADFAKAGEKLKELLLRDATKQEILSFLLYPKVYEEFVNHQKAYGNTSMLSTPVFFYGPEIGEEVTAEIEEGKTLIIKFLTISEPHADGTRSVFFELNGQPRDVTVADRSLDAVAVRTVKADPANIKQIGAAMPGMVVTVAMKVGDKVAKGQKLLTLEAMKMETTVNCEVDGEVASVLVKPGSRVEAGDLLVTFV